MPRSLRIAVSQFPVRNDIAANTRSMLAHIARAGREGADVVHFPETSLSGYMMEETPENWRLLTLANEEVADAAKRAHIHVVYGTYHRDILAAKPYNSTYVLSHEGALVGRYDKINLYGAEAERFSSGRELLVLDIEGVKCGFLICYDSSFPELFIEYRRLGVELLFLSYYNAGSRKGKNDMDRLMTAQFVTRSTDTGMHISGSNVRTVFTYARVIRAAGRRTCTTRPP